MTNLIQKPSSAPQLEADRQPTAKPPAHTACRGLCVSIERGRTYRMSMYSPARALFMLRTAQNLPHMEQVSLWSSSGRRASRMPWRSPGRWHRQTVHPSPAHGGHRPSCRRCRGHGGCPWRCPRHGRRSWKHDALLHVVHIGQCQMLGGGHIAQESCTAGRCHCAADGGRDVVVTGGDVGDEGSQHIEGCAHADALLDFHVGGDLIQGHMAGAFDHDLHVVGPGALGQPHPDGPASSIWQTSVASARQPGRRRHPARRSHRAPRRCPGSHRSARRTGSRCRSCTSRQRPASRRG